MLSRSLYIESVLKYYFPSFIFNILFQKTSNLSKISLFFYYFLNFKSSCTFFQNTKFRTISTHVIFLNGVPLFI